MGREGMPRREARPPFRSASNPCLIARQLPDISHSTSTPPPPVSRFMRAAGAVYAQYLHVGVHVRLAHPRLERGFVSDMRFERYVVAALHLADVLACFYYLA